MQGDYSILRLPLFILFAAQGKNTIRSFHSVPKACEPQGKTYLAGQRGSRSQATGGTLQLTAWLWPLQSPSELEFDKPSYTDHSFKKKEASCTHTERNAFMEWWLGQGLTGQGTRALKIRKQGNMSQWRCYFSHAAQEIFARVNIWLRNNEVQLQDLRRSLTRNSKCHGSDITGG